MISVWLGDRSSGFSLFTLTKGSRDLGSELSVAGSEVWVLDRTFGWLGWTSRWLDRRFGDWIGRLGGWVGRLDGWIGARGGWVRRLCGWIGCLGTGSDVWVAGPDVSVVGSELAVAGYESDGAFLVCSLSLSCFSSLVLSVLLCVESDPEMN